MSEPLSTHHPLISMEQCVQERVQRFLEVFGFSIFHYTRCDLNGNVSCLGTYSMTFRKFVVGKSKELFLYTDFPKEFQSYQKYTMLSKDFESQKTVKIAAEMGYFDGIKTVYRYKDYYETFVLALSTPIDDVASFYLNKQAYLDHFFLEFKSKNKDIK